MVARALLEQPLRHGFVEFHQPVLSPSLRPPHRVCSEGPLLTDSTVANAADASDSYHHIRDS